MARWFRPLMMVAVSALALHAARAKACDIPRHPQPIIPPATAYAPAPVYPAPVYPAPVVVDDERAWARDADFDHDRHFRHERAEARFERARERFGRRWGWNPRAMAWFDRYQERELRRLAWAEHGHDHHRGW